MKKDEMNETTKKSIRKINIDDLPKSEDQTADLKGDTQVWDDLPLEDEFEFHPDYDEMGFFEDDFAKEPVSRKKTSKASEETTSEKTSGKRRIKKIQLTPEEIQERKEVQKKRRSQNPEILAVTYTFVALFVLMIGYFVYFNAFVSKDVINSAYNVRINSFEETVTRGSIVSNDGTVLAETLTDENGNETRYYPMGRIFAHAIGTAVINQSGVELSHYFYMLQSNGNPIWNLIRDIQGEKNPGDRVVTT